MKDIYDTCCKTIAIATICYCTGISAASAQTPDYTQANYRPSNMGNVIPAGSNYSAIREKTTFTFINNDPTTKLLAPVSMTDFFAGSGNGAVELVWRVEQEPNLKRYEIEYSKDNITFQQVGIVNAGTYLNGKAYTFRHTPVNARDRIFYRLRMIDQTGRYDYSPVISLIIAGNSGNYVFPTMVNTGVISVVLNESFEAIQIVDMQGKILQTLNINGKTGRTDIPLTQAAKGICLVRILGQPQNNQPPKNIIQKMVFIQ